MTEQPSDRTLKLGGKQFTNVGDYVRGFLKAVRTHRRLNQRRELKVTIEPDGELPLAQRVLLR